MAIRRLGYDWNLRTLMAARNIYKTTELAVLLRERGIDLSASQVYRLVMEKPERLSLNTLAALCDILGCSPADLIDTYVIAAKKKAAGHSQTNVVDMANIRPSRARIVED